MKQFLRRLGKRERPGLQAAGGIQAAHAIGTAAPAPVILDYVRPVLAAAEAVADIGAEAVLAMLRRDLGLDDFAAVMFNLPLAEYPKLSAVLPRMASEAVQREWTGTSGSPLLIQSSAFIRAAAGAYLRHRVADLASAKVLDFGSGYGRLMRLMYWYTSPANITGVDPWHLSISVCRDDGVLGTLAQSDYVPTTLPVNGARFDLIYAFSVFTHLSEPATKAALATLRAHIADTGLLVITIRPLEYWSMQALDAERRTEMVGRHSTTGFAFASHQRDEAAGGATYGDTSMTLDHLAVLAAGWRIDGYDRHEVDPMQQIVFLTPA